MNKKEIINEIINALKNEQEIEKIILFGSILNSDHPNDIDIAILQKSTENYISLALKYRKLLRKLSQNYPIDVFPIKNFLEENFFLKEIQKGDVIFERGN